MAIKSDDGYRTSVSGDESVTDSRPNEFDAAVTAAIDRRSVPTASTRLAQTGEAQNDPAPPPSSREEILVPGHLLRGRFEIVEHVHSGGMSHIYKAIDWHQRRSATEPTHVAIKMMRQLLDSQTDNNDLLKREAAKAAELAHPNVVRILDHDEGDGQFFLVMEWLRGQSLNELLRRTEGKSLAPDFVDRVIAGIVAGVSHAHSHNIVHADLHPANVFLTDTQEIKLLDFGVARYGEEAGRTEPESPMWATPSYASPQVLRGMTPTFADDVFSLACIAYRLRSGRLPFASHTSLTAMEAQEEVETLPTVAAAIAEPIIRGLAYEREARPRSVGVFAKPQSATRLSNLPLEFYRHALTPRKFAIPAAIAIGVAAIGWLLFTADDTLDGSVPATEVTAQVEPEVSDPVAAEVAPIPPEDAELSALLHDAETALLEQRLVLPEDGGARGLYRQALVRDPDNAAAQLGLRSISSHYADEANAALRAGDIENAVAALAVAAETDPQNPSIGVVREFLAARADRVLADARLALAAGDREQAAQLLAEAERYPTANIELIAETRSQITRSALEQRFRDQLAIVDGHLATGQLTTPADNNARDLLVGLRGEYRDNEQVEQYVLRLGERLLSRAAFATAEGRFGDASDTLTALESLGVLQAEIGAAQLSLQFAMLQMDEASPAEFTSVEGGGSAITNVVADADSTAIDTDAQTGAGEIDPAAMRNDSVQLADAIVTPDAIVGTPRVDLGVGQAGSAVIAGNEPSDSTISNGAVAAAATAGPGASEEPQRAQYRTLAELAVLDFVAPRYPPRAERGGLTGYVDLMFTVETDGTTSDIEIIDARHGSVFVSSSRRAVQQWRFAERAEPIRSRIRLTFD